MEDNFEISDLPLTEDFYDTITLKTAVWQFMVDHFAAGPGQFQVKMFCTTEEDFWRRVNARRNRKYTTKDMATEYEKSIRKETELRKLRIGRTKSLARDKILKQLKTGTLLEKIRYSIILFLRHIANKLM